MFHLEPPCDDGLIISEVGEHSKYKHHFIRRYIDAFTTAMKNKGWSGLHYVDLFAGAGIERLRDSRALEWGSPMIAAQAPYPFDGLHLCERDERKYDALVKRISLVRPDSQIMMGDANEQVLTITRAIPDRTLSLCFLDPYGLHVDLQTLKILASKRMDLILFFPDRVDALRNWDAYYLNNPESNLDRCLGGSVDWRTRLQEAPAHCQAEILRNMYIEVIRTELKYDPGPARTFRQIGLAR
jgi:three-Cys-motif partner protein